MRFPVVGLTLLAALASALPSATTPSDELGNPQGMTYDTAHKVQERACSTNAECLRLGRGIVPQSRGRQRRLTPGTSMTPIAYVRGNLVVLNADTGAQVGYIGKPSATNGVYGIAPDQSSASVFSYDPALGVSNINLLSDASTLLPYICASVGPASTSESLAPGSYNYGFLVACETTTPANSPPAPGTNSRGSVQGRETAIFSLNGNQVTVQWTNTDGSSPATFLIYAASSNNFLSYTGDVASYKTHFGANRFQVRYRFDVIV